MQKFIFVLAISFCFCFTTHAQNFEWVKQIAGPGSNLPSQILTDQEGNIYKTGYYTGTADFDPGTDTANLTSVGGWDIFIQKLDSSGNFIWAKSMGGPRDDYGSGIAVDGFGNVYSFGVYQATTNFDPNGKNTVLKAGHGWEWFLQKRNPSGELLWVQQMKAKDPAQVKSIAVDIDGNIYATGTVLEVDSRNGDIFIQKMNSEGKSLWTKRIGGKFSDSGNSIALDSFGNVFVVGGFTDTLWMAQTSDSKFHVANGLPDSFLSKLDLDGNFLWTKTLGQKGENYGLSVQTDPLGNVVAKGACSDSIKVMTDSGYGMVSGGDFLSKYDPKGLHLWTKKVGSKGCYATAVDKEGNIYSAGHFGGTIDFDPGLAVSNQTAKAYWSIFVQKLDPSGNLLWATQTEGPGSGEGASITISPSGSVLLTGRFQQTIDFDPGPEEAKLTWKGGFDIYTLKLSPR